MKTRILVLLVFLLTACTPPAPPVLTDTPRPIATTYVVTLFCPECAETGQEINLWSTVTRQGVAGSVPHNTQVTVIDTTLNDGVRYYKVSANGVTGWVSELFVKK